ncbi:cystathionine gamma-synthase [Zobellella denitrificans]|jgi:cytochrome c-type biogenesis protein CcmH|uniref:Cytochrome c-type biogenesis protein n=1 Tax=Zobellella denitrificans TaxID=347534 RepID=A0A231MYM0_9GAMM|nr:cytochrome c-type biogenesis protein [Zobellella denitrificans]ATG73230.1 cystathionine gamma-synthase [Zobellella denitrificans]OXS15120.1 cystathionine gamma-synthase [Zobellella denitrificans]
MRFLSFLVLLAGLVLTAPLPARAAIDVYEFDSPEQEAVFRELVRELRCPKCQNQDISDSNAELAKDLRDKTYEMLREGNSKQEIIDFMVARYGNFILYRPPLMASTLILWAGPVLVILLGLCVVLVRTRRKGGGQGEALSTEEKKRLAELLNKDKES